MRKKYCSRSCAAIVNNSKFIKRTANQFSNCKKCNIAVSLKKNLQGGFYKRDYCEPCLKLIKVFNITGVKSEEDFFINQTKGSLYRRRKNWQSSNSALRKHARQVYFSSDAPKRCKECGYDKHIEVCHIKQVKEFDDEASILVINGLDNLVALCPTHHWEFDNLKKD